MGNCRHVFNLVICCTPVTCCSLALVQTASVGGGGMFVPMSPRLSSPAHPSSGGGVGGGGGGMGGGCNATPDGGGRGRGRGMPDRRDREMIEQTVRIIQEPYKGSLLQLFRT